MRRRALFHHSLAAAGLLAGASSAQGKPGEVPADEELRRRVWPVALADLQGEFRFVQVASPGGLWLRLRKAQGGTVRQISLHEAPAEFRKKLEGAVLELRNVQRVGPIEVSDERSPSGRGTIRRYTENGSGSLVLKGIPGIGGESGDSGEHTGPVELELSHTSHSNPSPSGIFRLRLSQEPTWGAATIDYADLVAVAPPSARRQPASLQQPGQEEDAEPLIVVGNARVMRSGYEIFAFVQWLKEERDQLVDIVGAVRLLRSDLYPQGPEDPAAPGPLTKPLERAPVT